MNRKIFITAILIFALKISQAQPPNSNVSLSIEVKCIDSAYMMIPKLRVLNRSIQIHKKLYYGTEPNILADCNILFQKQINGEFLGIYYPFFSHPEYDEDYLILKNFTSSDLLKDSINLKWFIPLDSGKYKIILLLHYYHNGKKFAIYSNLYDFDVAFKPKNSIF